jgi:hypothetical protein
MQKHATSLTWLIFSQPQVRSPSKEFSKNLMGTRSVPRYKSVVSSNALSKEKSLSFKLGLNKFSSEQRLFLYKSKNGPNLTLPNVT